MTGTTGSNGPSSEAPSGFIIEDSPEGRTLVVTGKWTGEAAAALDAGRADGLELNDARGYRERDLDFLEQWKIRRLLLLDRRVSDLSPLGRLGNTLEELRVDSKLEAEIDLAAFQRLGTLAASWNQVQATVSRKGGSLRDLLLFSYPNEDLHELTALRRLETLRLVDAGELRTLDGVEAFSLLSGLHLFHAAKLEDLTSLVATQATLKELELEDCPKISTLDGIGHLKHLVILGVSDCGRIESIKPVSALSKLEELHAWGATLIEDGDLSPLVSLSILRELRMRERKEYRPRVSEFSPPSSPGRKDSGDSQR
jgi:internalin A